ncbi:MAG: ABC transporter substrate-binding protein [Turicibacter sp.]|nr:ABC transporter substrate-binding protein [Turicibacter sp.]
MKKLLGIALFVLTLAGCGNDGREQLFVYNWGEYMDPEAIRLFEDEFGVRVVYDTFDSNETMYQVLRAGTTQYDVVFPSDYKIERMISEGMLLPLDFDKLPNATHISENLLGLGFDPQNRYSVPYFWGTVGIVYDTKVVSGPVDSWSILWDEAYGGQIYMYDSQRDSLMVALKLLGYSLNTTDMDELAAARDLLIKQSPLVIAYVTDHVIMSMIAGNAALAVVYSGDAAFIMSENPNMNFAIPKEGTNLWVDAMVIPKGANNPDLAHAFINFMHRADIAEMNTRHVMYSTPNVLALEAVKGEVWADNFAYNPPREVLDGIPMEMFRDPGAYLEIYDRIWSEVLIGAR